jgi:Heliorhodopsin
MNQTNNKPEYKNLGKWNAIMGVLHLIQGIIMVIISKETLTDISLWLPKLIPSQRTFELVPEKWYSVNLGYAISSFLFLSAIAHFITILPGVYQWYLNNLKYKINLIRWYEYALSSSVMVFVIANLSGVRDGMTLLLLFGINACMNLFGASMEMQASAERKLSMLKQTGKSDIAQVEQDLDEDKEFRPNWSSFIYGCFAGILPWVVMGLYFFVTLDRIGSVEEIPQRVKDTLNTVRFIFPALFVFFNLFAINMILQYKRLGPWKRYIFGEKTYIILSLLAKTFLAWFIWGGTLRG